VTQFQTYYEELVAWNDRVNLTAITDYSEVQIKHFLDSLTVTLALRPSTDFTRLKVIDVGSGPGMPGLPLKIVWPSIQFAFLEATTKKADFLKHVISKLGLERALVVNARAEDAAHDSDHRQQYDLVVSRGVAAMPVLAELTLPFCAMGGTAVAQKLCDARGEIEDAATAVSILGGELRGVIDITLPELAGRCLFVYDKCEPTPPEYPRRSGMPEKKPLV
jgi:16S rRNA (guanine527-N7)-methyltransferase